MGGSGLWRFLAIICNIDLNHIILTGVTLYICIALIILAFGMIAGAFILTIIESIFDIVSWSDDRYNERNEEK